MDRGRSDRGYGDRRAAGQQNPGRKPAPRPSGSSAYDGRFGTSADAGRKRPTGSYRTQPSGSYRSRMGYEQDGLRRPSVQQGGDHYTRRPAPKAPPVRRKKEKKGNPLLVVLGVLALLALAGLIVLVVTSSGKTYHHMPIVERIGSAIVEDV